MKITLRLVDLVQQGEVGWKTYASLLGNQLAVLDCTDVTVVPPGMFEVLLGEIPPRWELILEGEVITLTSLSDSLRNELLGWVETRREPVEPKLQDRLPENSDTSSISTVLHPIRVLDQVIDEYRDHINTEFRPRDLNVRAAFEAEVARPGFLAQEPYFQAHRPFQTVSFWEDLPIDRKLAKVLHKRIEGQPAYRHQSDAVLHLLGPNASATVISTGTGSGKTECFMIPVLHNAIQDALQFKRAGLTAILVYPMNALANDQRDRLDKYITQAGYSGLVRVAQYDQRTAQEERRKLRETPPHILLTNYMMLEYLLIRPADRKGLFTNHRCRFLVLDEVHVYRGGLGSNIALLVRRVREHLCRSTHTWLENPPAELQEKRFPSLIPVGTSATIKSVAGSDLSPTEERKLREQAVQEFFGKLTGELPATVKVIGEEIQPAIFPSESTYPPEPVTWQPIEFESFASIQKGLCRLAGVPPGTPVEEAARRCRLLWDLNAWLGKAPLSLTELVQKVKSSVPARAACSEQEIETEIRLALTIGAALDGTAGELRLRTHRFVRGGWEFHRCVSPDCLQLYPHARERCECGHRVAPMYLCRSCGADYLQFQGDSFDKPLVPGTAVSGQTEYILYEVARLATPQDRDEDDELAETDEIESFRAGRSRSPKEIKSRPVFWGSFDPTTLSFSLDETAFRVKAALLPDRSRCLCCGNRAGGRTLLTAVALGTSAAVKVLSESMIESLAEVHRGLPDFADKERLLVFSDSRQDAAHQARFIAFAARYDRMRRRVVQLLQKTESLSLQKLIEELAESGRINRDNPNLPESQEARITRERLEKIRIWEEAPLLDDISVNAGFRATLVNLGLVDVVYEGLEDFVHSTGIPLAARLGINPQELSHLCRCILDIVRTRGCLGRDLLRYHRNSPQFPETLRAAELERRITHPQGFPLTPDNKPALRLSAPPNPGIRVQNLWRKPGAGGQSPRVESLIKTLLNRFGTGEPQNEVALQLFEFLIQGAYLAPFELFGYRDSQKLLQLNGETLYLRLTPDSKRFRCDVCFLPLSGTENGMPCPRCFGKAVPWQAEEVMASRYVRRIKAQTATPIEAREHTAQIPNSVRKEIEDEFKDATKEARVNLLACSPTLEMGVDVGGLDAVVLRNIPPRPDNYAQRGGRAGRRTRVGLVLGYARKTPHDQYFFEHPTEMIAGAVPAPALALGNRDVLFRHLAAIAFGASEPGVAGKMADYVTTGGTIIQEAVDQLKDGIRASSAYAVEVAQKAWGRDVLLEANVTETDLREHLARLPDRVQDVIARTARQVSEMRRAIENFSEKLEEKYPAARASEMIRKLLGLPPDEGPGGADSNDRSGGYPLRRFAEFGLLPGYEFPSEPASLRLLRDKNEDEPLSIKRELGLNQFRPEAHVYARTKRWEVIGLDLASPWNPSTPGPGWHYARCKICLLRFDGQSPACPRCGYAGITKDYPAAEYAGFVARIQETPILDEEDRFAVRNLVTPQPQWNGVVMGRWDVGLGATLRLSQDEEIKWLNEGKPPSERDLKSSVCLHDEGKGFSLCPACGRLLSLPEKKTEPGGGRRRPRAQTEYNDFGHAPKCSQIHSAPEPLALVSSTKAEVLRFLVPIRTDVEKPAAQTWGYSIGYALLAGMQHRFMLEPGEIQVEFEGPWKTQIEGAETGIVSVAFIDTTLGGSGYLPKIAGEFNQVAIQALEHLKHPDCEQACYRCLKSYQNQRQHHLLNWPLVVADLTSLAETQPWTRALTAKDLDHPQPWLDAYAEGLDSPLELRFWRLFQSFGFTPEKQYEIRLNESGNAFTRADFAVPEKRLAIYVDGAAFHVGGRLRRDHLIRQRLQGLNPTWNVVSLTSNDLTRGLELVKELKTK